MFDTAPAPPDGFRPFGNDHGFIGVNGPLHIKREDDGLAFGAWITERHVNGMDICHGGWLASLMDMVLPIGAGAMLKSPTHYFLTVSLTLDYLAPAPLGAWIEGRAQLLRETRTLIFAQGLLTLNGAPVLRGSGVFKLGPPREPAQDAVPGR